MAKRIFTLGGPDDRRFFQQVGPRNDLTMVIPKIFATRHLNPLPAELSLKAGDGLEWSVNVEVTENGVELINGWPIFRDSYLIDEQDVLLFTYDMNKTLYVTIMEGSTKCEKDVTYSLDLNSSPGASGENIVKTSNAQTFHKIHEASSSAAPPDELIQCSQLRLSETRCNDKGKEAVAFPTYSRSRERKTRSIADLTSVPAPFQPSTDMIWNRRQERTPRQASPTPVRMDEYDSGSNNDDNDSNPESDTHSHGKAPKAEAGSQGVPTFNLQGNFPAHMFANIGSSASREAAAMFNPPTSGVSGFFQGSGSRARNVTINNNISPPPGSFAHHIMQPLPAVVPLTPMCFIILRKTYISRAFAMFLPAEFAQQVMRGIVLHVKLRTPGSIRLWPVTVRKYFSKYRVSAGWRGFVAGNDIAVGNCIRIQVSADNAQIWNVIILK